MQSLISTLVSFALLFIPGYVLLRQVKMLDGGLRFALAPVCSSSLYICLAILFPVIGVRTSGALLLSVALVIALLPAVGRVLHERKNEAQGIACSPEKTCTFTKLGISSQPVRFDILTLFLSVLLAICATGLLIWQLGGFESCIYGYDTVFHVNLVKSYLESGNYSPLSASIYPLTDSLTTIPYERNPGSFYPSLLHIVAAMTVDLTGCSVAASLNVANLSFCGVAYSVGIWAVMRELFADDKRARLYATFISMSVAAFPWHMLVRGEQYPQVAAFALVPAVLALVARFVNVLADSKEMRRVCPGTVLGVLTVFLAFVTLAFAQPNSVFTVGVFMLPYITYVIWTHSSKRLLHTALWLAIAVLIWVFFYTAPFMQGTVGYYWPSFAGKSQAVVNLLSLSLYEGSVAQPVLAVAVIIGLFCSASAYRDGKVWVVALYGLVGAIYVVDTASEGNLRHFLAGFWYSDPDRIAAMVAICIVPIASLGLSRATMLIEGMLSLATSGTGALTSKITTLVVYFATFAVCAWPSYYVSTAGETVTPFGRIRDDVRRLTDSNFVAILDTEEQRFVQQVRDIVPDGAKILNVPDDGSSFLYGLYDLNVYYHRGQLGNNESTDSEILRHGLYRYSYDESVQEAVSRVGAEYVLVLDAPDVDDANRAVFGTYTAEDWIGIESVCESTEGFEPVLCEGDMRLYRILPVQ